MAVSNYRRGADLERALVRGLRERGWVAARSAGSKSGIDVWAVRDGELRLFQCAVQRTAAKCNAVAELTIEVGFMVRLVCNSTLEDRLAESA